MDKEVKGSEKTTWSNQVEFFLSLLGYVIGLGNLWRFPYVCYRNGGGAFLVPYLGSMLIIGLPMYVGEIGMGQYTRSGKINAWNRIPIMKGIGFGSIIMCFFSMPPYMMVMSWSLFYLGHSFNSDLPWATCGHHWNSNSCISIAQSSSTNLSINPQTNLSINPQTNLSINPQTNLSINPQTNLSINPQTNLSINPQTNLSINPQTNLSINPQTNLSINQSTNFSYSQSSLSQVQFWRNYVFQNGDLEYTFSWPMLVCVVVAHFIVFVVIIKGIRSSGKVVYVTATFPYLMLLTLLIRALTLDGAGEGVRLFLVPKFGDLLNPQVWVEASAQVILTLGITYPGLTAFGSYNKFRNDFYKQSIYVVPLGAATSLLMGVVTFSLLGHLSHTQGVKVEDLIQSGPGLVFQIYPVGLSLMPLPQFWSVLFFLMFILVAVDSAFAEFEGIIVGISDAYPIMTSSTKYRALTTIIVGIMFCCITMVLLTPYGPRIFELVYYYGASTITLLWLAMFESIALGWFWNANQFSCDVKTMTGRSLPKLFEISFRFIIPTVITAIFCFYCSQWRPLSVGEYVYPTWANVIGWLLAASSMLCIPIGAFVFLWKQEGNLKQKWMQAFQYQGTTLVPQSDYTDTSV